MRPPFYLRQLKIDLETWIAKGLVPAESRAAILESVGEGSSSNRLVLIFAVLGVILVGLGALSFVGANWAEMTKLTRLVVLFGALWLAYGLAGTFVLRGSDVIAQAFVLLGVLLFGTNIWFVAQTYNINSHFPDGILLWGLGALAAAAIVPSRASLAAAIALGGYWTFAESQAGDRTIHVLYLIYWAAGAALALQLNWRPAVHLSALALILWFVISREGIQSVLGWGDAEMHSIYVLVPLAIWSAMQIFESGANGFTLTTGHYAFFAFLTAFALLHFSNGKAEGPAAAWFVFAALASLAAIGGCLASMQRKGSTALDLAGTAFACVATIAYVMTVGRGDAFDIPMLVATLIVIVWSISRGVRLEDRFVVNLSLVAFGFWTLYVYFELFEDLLLVNQALFFTVGGVLLIVLALGLEQTRRRLTAKPAKA